MAFPQADTCIIRDAEPADIPLIRDLAYRIWPSAYSAILRPGQLEYMLDLMYSVSSLAKQMVDGARFILSYREDEPVGFASYQEIKPGIYKLHKLYVLPSEQGKGTGKKLIDHIFNVIGPAGATALQLQVNRENRARYFYEKIGFTIIDEINLDIGGGYFMNDYVMEYRFGDLMIW